VLLEAVTLDAAMTARQALRRLAKHGYWIDADDVEASAWLEEYAASVRDAALSGASEQQENAAGSSDELAIDPAKLTAKQAAALLERPLKQGRVAIRRQVGSTIFWYARSVEQVLDDLVNATDPDDTVAEALHLHEYTADPWEQASNLDTTTAAQFSGVLLNGQDPVAIGEVQLTLGAPRRTPAGSRGMPTVKKPRAKRGAKAVTIRAHPKLDAPREVVVGKPFNFVVGLGASAQRGTRSSGAFTITADPGQETVPIELHIIADGFHVKGSTRPTLDVAVSDPTKARVTVELTALPQADDVRTTSLIVHFVRDGVVCGSAGRHIVVEQKKGIAKKIAAAAKGGQRWEDAEMPPPALVLASTGAADIEVDIAKPDGNTTNGRYKCVIRNAHGVPVPSAPLSIDLGDDAETFAKSVMDMAWRWSSDPLGRRLLENVGSKVATKLPAEFWAMLDAVGKKVTGEGRPATLQLNSAESYVPWELSFVEKPLDPKRPQFLGAQVVMGRWILGDSAIPTPPRDTLNVKAMAVVAGMYNKKQSGLNPLPEALKEAQEIAKAFATMPAVPLNCTPENFDSLLEAELTHNLMPIGGVEAVHFAGHGYTDPKSPGDAALYLSDGRPLSPFFFCKSKLGKEHQPFIFLNACMVGSAGEMLGDTGGFPGNCLAGGFSGLLAPLWIVHDDVAKNFALEFYAKALAEGGARSVAEVVRDLRANYTKEKPNATYLAYVFYGNPALKLVRATSS
jgi:hypothetical protein